ncbi:MAG: hypothetical protein ABI175_18340 [Polyangiales bacterium]
MKKLVVTLIVIVSFATANAKPRKQSTAYAISGIGTGVSLALFTSAFFFPNENHDLNAPLLWSGMATSLVTPSLGNFYADHWLNIGMGVRLAAGALGAYTAATMRQEHRCSELMPKTCTELTDNGMIALGIVGVIYVGGAAYDFKVLGEQVDAYNARHPFQWAPVLTPSPSGTGALLGVGGSF